MNIASVFNALPTIYQNGLVVAGIEAPRGWTIEHGPGPAEFGVLGTPSIILFQGRKGSFYPIDPPITNKCLEIARFNETEHDFKRIKTWVSRTTKLTPQPIPEEFNLVDYIEPVPTQLIKQTDIGLIVSIFSLSLILVVKISPNVFARIVGV